MINEAFKPLGVISLLAMWVALLVLITKWRGHRGMSFSKHAASNKTAYLAMAVVQSIMFPLLFLFVIKWFVPTFELPALFTVVIGGTIAGFLIGAWVPDTKGWKSSVHGISTYGAAMLLIPAATMLVVSPNVSTAAKSLACITLVYLIACPVLFIAAPKIRDYHLIVQALYFLAFDALIIVTTYVR